MPTAIDHNFATVGVGQFLHTAAPAVGGAWSGAWIGDPTATSTLWVGDGSGVVIQGVSDVPQAAAASNTFGTEASADLVVTAVVDAPQSPAGEPGTLLYLVVSNSARDKTVGTALISDGVGFTIGLSAEDSATSTFLYQDQAVASITWPATLVMEVTRSTGAVVVKLNGTTILTGAAFADVLYAVESFEAVLYAESPAGVSNRSARISSYQLTSTGAVTTGGGGPGGGGPGGGTGTPPPTSFDVRVSDDFSAPVGDWARSAVAGAEPEDLRRLAFRTLPTQENVSGVKWVAFLRYGAAGPTSDQLAISSGTLSTRPAVPASDGGAVHIALLPATTTFGTVWGAATPLPTTGVLNGLLPAFGVQTWTSVTIRVPGGLGLPTLIGDYQYGLMAYFVGSSEPFSVRKSGTSVIVALQGNVVTLAEPAPGWVPDEVTVTRQGFVTMVKDGGASLAVQVPVSVGDLAGLTFVAPLTTTSLVLQEFDLSFDEMLAQQFWTGFVGTYEVI